MELLTRPTAKSVEPQIIPALQMSCMQFATCHVLYEYVHSVLCVERYEELYIFNTKSPSICCALFVNISSRQTQTWNIQKRSQSQSHTCKHTHKGCTLSQK